VRLATDRPARKGADPQTDWHEVVCWGKTGEFAGEYLEKGRLVYVTGRISYRTYETQEGERRRVAEIVAYDIVPLDKRPARAADDGEEPEEAEEPEELSAEPAASPTPIRPAATEDERAAA
jgi:single-strand DNA-binding protein